jgi:hypothetical protein
MHCLLLQLRPHIFFKWSANLVRTYCLIFVFCYRGGGGKQRQHQDQLVLAAVPLMVVPSALAAAIEGERTYTITNSRESWTELEHDKFLEALQL